MIIFENEIPFYLIQTLHSIRFKNGMTSSEVAKKLNIDVDKYKEWEVDSSNISYFHILKLEEIFQIPSRYIYFGKNIIESNPQNHFPNDLTEKN